jgi:hypothetical protein
MDTYAGACNPGICPWAPAVLMPAVLIIPVVSTQQKNKVIGFILFFLLSLFRGESGIHHG